MGKKINIRPTTSVYATYKNIKYDPWTAIAEYVDNSTQSYYDNVERLEKIKNWNGLDVEIIYEKSNKNDEDDDEGDKLIIRDNAFGMDFDAFQRAIILDSKPEKPSRSEFGMGLKTASCWFGTNWSVESTALGSKIKYKATIDVELLSKYKDEEIIVEEIPCDANEHGTTISISNLNRTISGRQIAKVKDQLRGMYRCDLRTGKIRIYYNGDGLSYEDPAILEEKLASGKIKKWKKDIEFDISCKKKKYHVNGFIALRDEGSTSGAGFTLIRRGRVIRGGYENCYRPEEVFKKPNSYTYQRLFGELNLDDWPVTQTKDDFDWYSSGLEDKFIEKLQILTADYSAKAEVYRKSKKVEVEEVIENVAKSFSNAGIIQDVKVDNLPKELVKELKNEENKSTNEQTQKVEGTGEIQIQGGQGKHISFKCDSLEYKFNFVLKTDNPNVNWLNISQTGEEYLVEWNIRHPFFKPYIDDPKFLELMEHFIFSLTLSELQARKTGVNGLVNPGEIRMRMNDTLKAIKYQA